MENKNCSRSYSQLYHISKSKKLPKYGKYFLIKGNIKAIESISDANFAFESRKKQLE
jgi:hypothetical protein